MPLARNVFADPVSCPECEEETRIGLPRSATVGAVSCRPTPEIDTGHTDGGASRQKVRQSCCRNGHLFYVYFEF
jgi:hypothetical protein